MGSDSVQRERVHVVDAVYGRAVEHPRWRWSVLPGTCPKVMTGQQARAISEHRDQWWWAHKTDGTRAIVSLRASGLLTAFDRRFDPVVQESVRGVGMLLGGDSVVDAEMVHSVEDPMGRKVFLLHDAFLVEGINVSEQPFDVRRRMGARLCSRLNHVLGDGWLIAFKPFERVAGTDADELRQAMCRDSSFDVSVDGRKLRRFAADGAVFMHDSVAAHDQRSPWVTKFKPPSRCTVDFAIGSDGRTLQLHHDDALFNAGSLPFDAQPLPRGTVVECAMGDTGEWRVVHVRSDRSKPNSAAAAFQTTVFTQAASAFIDTICSGSTRLGPAKRRVPE